MSYKILMIPLQIKVVDEMYIKFIHSEKATKFCEIFILLLTVCTVVKIKVKISQNFVAFSEYMNFTKNCSDLSLLE